MATDGLFLLRMLEPPVRPDGVFSPAPPPTPPIESRGFDAILAEAQEITGSGEAGGEKVAKSGIDALQVLAQLDRVQNGTVRAWMAKREGATGQADGGGV